jgi:hypothetical protein
VLQKTHASLSSAATKITTAPSTTSAKLARTSRSPGSLSTTPGALLSRQQRYVVWPDKFRLDISAHYDGTSNPVEFLQLYVIAV